MSRDPRKITGTDLQDAIVDLAHGLGFIAAHFRNSRTADGRHVTAVAYDGKGFPDLVLARLGRVIFAEVKGDGDRLRPEQAEWIRQLENDPTVWATHRAYVWTADDWRSGEIREVLELNREIVAQTDQRWRQKRAADPS